MVFDGTCCRVWGKEIVSMVTEAILTEFSKRSRLHDNVVSLHKELARE